MAPRGLLFAVLLVLGSAALAHADEVTGTWTGAVEAWGNYYWERSTRVVAPNLDVRLESPSGIELNASYLLDAITSASQAAGALTDNRFTEIRNELIVGAGYEWGLERSALRVAGSLRGSREPDYGSIAGNLLVGLALNDRATLLRFDVGVLRDEVRQNFRGGTGVRPGDGGTTAEAFEEQLTAVRGAVGVDQILSRIAHVQATYELTYLSGYLANPYRLVSVANVLRPEAHPNERLRHTVSARLALAIPPMHAAVHLLYRAYIDSWRIGALTPEVRLYQDLSRFATLRVRHRHYRQTRAYFFEPDPNDYAATDLLVSADPKMSEFHSNLLGFQVALGLGFFEGTALRRLAHGSVGIDLEYLWSTNAFGDALIAQLGARFPF
jgi:hypothetical protein